MAVGGMGLDEAVRALLAAGADPAPGRPSAPATARFVDLPGSPELPS